MPHPYSTPTRTYMTPEECAEASGTSLDDVMEFIRDTQPRFCGGRPTDGNGYHRAIVHIDDEVYIVEQQYAAYLLYGTRDW